MDDAHAPTCLFHNRVTEVEYNNNNNKNNNIFSYSKKPPVAPRPKRIVERCASLGSIVSVEDCGLAGDHGLLSPLHMAEKLLPPSSLKYSPNNTDETSSDSKNRPPKETTERITPMVLFKEDWATKQECIKNQIKFSDRLGWRLLPVLVKSNDDMR